MKDNSDMNLLNRITINPDILHGKPAIRNKRYSVESILSYLAGGDTTGSLLEEFSDLEEDDIKACLLYAQKMLENNTAFLTAS